MKTKLLVVAFFGSVVFSFAQNGPGGVGNSDGSGGQPQNILWIDANDLGLADGTDVSTWSDKSGNGYVFGASTGNTTSTLGDGTNANFPSFESDVSSLINGFPVVRFDDSNAERLVINPFTGFPSSAITTIMVFKTANTFEGIVSYNNTSQDNEYLLFDANDLRTYVNASFQTGGDFNTPSNTETILVSRWTSTGGTVEHYKDGGQTLSTTTSTSALSDGGALAIGGEQDNVDDGYATNQDFGGDIAEILMFSAFLNDAQRTLVENYLSEKYGITISSTDAYGNGGSFNSGYVYEIGGVGKDGTDTHDEGGSAGFYLEIVSSISMNSGDYVMVGHNNGSKGSSNSDLGGTSPTITDRWERDWYLEKTSSTSVGSNIYLEFDFPDGITGGLFPQALTNYYLLYRSTTSGNYSVVTPTSKSIVNGDRVQFELTEAQLANGYYTLGTSDNSASPIAGSGARTWYSYTDGNWNDPTTWTLDGSSFPDYDNPSSAIPSSIDNVVITDSKLVTVQNTTNNISIAGLELIGSLDLTSSSGHSFTTISGAGVIRLEGSSGSINFPGGDATSFADNSIGGTVEIYGTGLDLDAGLTLNNLIINLTSSTDQADVLADFTLNGNLDIESGTFQIDDGTAGTDLNISVTGNVAVQSNGRIRVGSANQRHQFDVYGDFTNEGSAYFTNRTTENFAAEATDGIVDLNFLNKVADQAITCDGECRFYRLEIDKAEVTDPNATYILDISASSVANFNLFGFAAQALAGSQLSTNDNAFGLISGTVRLNTNVTVNELTTNVNYIVSERARLWINGGELNTTANAIFTYGQTRIDGGVLVADGLNGITLGNDGTIEINGGQATTRMIKTSVQGPSNVGGYTQTGGSLILDGTGGINTDYSMFSLTYEENSFTMTGGTLTIRNTGGRGHMFIDANTYNVTGGTVIIEISSLTQYRIDTKVPLYNLTIQKTITDVTGTEAELAPITNEGPDDRTVGATQLVILNDLRLASSAGGFNTQLDPRQVDVFVGGDLYLEQNSTFESPSNEETDTDTGILTFNGSGERVFDLDNQASTVSFQYMTIAKDASTDKVTLINAPATALTLIDEFRVESGQFDIGSFDVEVQDELFVSDSIGSSTSTGTLLLNGSAAQVMSSDSDGGVIQDLELDNSNGVSLSGGDITVVNQLTMTSGVFDIATNGVTLLGSLSSETKGDYSTTRMIQTAGNDSDGGLTRQVSANGTLLYPIGTNANASTRYTPVEATFSNYPTADNALVSISIADTRLETMDNAITPAADNDKYLSYYWNVNHDSPATLPTVSYTFDYDASDVNSGTANTEYVAGKVLDETPFTRSYEGDAGIQVSTSVVTFDGLAADDDGTGARPGFTLENANYTAGFKDKFSGAPTVYYSRRHQIGGGNLSWTDVNDWSTDNVLQHGGAAASAIPGAGDVVVVGAGQINGSDEANDTGLTSTTARHQIVAGASRDVAEVIFNSNPAGTAIGNNLSRIRLSNTTWELTAGKISGLGEIMLAISTSDEATVVADLGEFNDTPNSTFFLDLTTAGTATFSSISEFPGIRIYGRNSAGRTLRFGNDITGQQILLDGMAILEVGNDITIDGNVQVGNNREGYIVFPDDGSNHIFSIGGDLITNEPNVSTNNQISVENSGSDIHTLRVGGNIDLQFGDVFDLAAASNVILELNGTGTNTFSNTSTANPDLYQIVMNKGTDITSTFSFNDDFDLSAPTSGFQPIVIQNGLLIFNDSNIGDVASKIELSNDANGSDFNIPGTAGFELQAGTVYLSGNSVGITLDGLLRVNGSNAELNMDISDTDNPGNGMGEDGNNFIEYTASGNSSIEINDGTFTVGSQIRRGLLTTTGVLSYSQTGGTVVLGKNAAPEATRGVLEVLNTGSSFTHTGGDLTIVRQNGGTPNIAALYLDPASSNISTSTITIGNTDTPANQDDIGINSSVTLDNLVINGSNSPTASIDVRPLVIGGDLTINSSNTLDGNALQLTVAGNFTNDGTYTPSGNITEFNASSGTQTLSGGGDFNFFDLVKSSNSTLTMGKTAMVNNDLTVNSPGIINTASFDLSVLGNVTIDGSVISDTDPTYNGIVFEGSAQQTLQRSGVGTSVIDIITIDNANGVEIPEASSFTFTINERVQLETGVFDIGGSSVELAQDADITTSTNFDANRMIVTNSADADKGLLKNFASGTGDASLADNLFIFPIGQDVYTPFTIDITSGTMGTTASSILVKPVDAPHPTVNNGVEDTSPTDLDNVLQYYWTITTTGITDFTGDFIFEYDQSDVSADDPSFTETDYITARIRAENNPTGQINKNDGAVDTGANTLTFSFTTEDTEILSADYFTGVDDAIPDLVPTYTVTGVGGNVDAAIYTPVVPGGSEPSGAIVIIPNGATLTLNIDAVRLYQVEVQSGGVLDVSSTSFHNLREVTGTGTIRVEGVTLPAASYDFSCAGLGIEYAGSTDYGLFSGISAVREVTVSGTGTRSFSKNLLVCNDFTIDGPTVQFNGGFTSTVDGDLILTSGTVALAPAYDLDIEGSMNLNGGAFSSGSTSELELAGDLSRTSGTFSASTGTVIFDGASSQQIAGDFTGTNALRNVTINNTSTGVTIIDGGNNGVDMDGTVTLTDGVFRSNTNNTLTLGSASSVSGGDVSSHFNGPVTRESLAASSTYEFKVGRDGRYAPATISLVGTGSQDWSAEYLQTNSNDPSSFDASDSGFGSLEEVSAIDLWNIGSSGTNTAQVELTYGPHNSVTSIADLRVVIWDGAEWDNEGGVATGDTNSGTVLAGNISSFSIQQFSLGTAGAALPIELKSFDGYVSESVNVLEWITSTETDNDYFELERSADGINYEVLTVIEGAGNSLVELEYQFVDEDPFFGRNYYRLRQVDFDGQSSYADKIVLLDNKSAKGELVYNLYPNPTSLRNIKMEISSPDEDRELQITVFDIYGRTHFVKQLSPTLLNETLTLIMPQSMSSGIYFVKVEQGDQQLQKRLVINSR